jgi:hypothetical protein
VIASRCGKKMDAEGKFFRSKLLRMNTPTAADVDTQQPWKMIVQAPALFSP